MSFWRLMFYLIDELRKAKSEVNKLRDENVRLHREIAVLRPNENVVRLR